MREQEDYAPEAGEEREPASLTMAQLRELLMEREPWRFALGDPYYAEVLRRTAAQLRFTDTVEVAKARAKDIK